MSSILGNFLAGQQAGRQQHQYRQEQSKLAQLQQLAPSVLAGDPAAYGKAAALDIDQANKLQTGRDGQLRRFGGFINFIDEAKASGDPRRLSAAMRQAAPYLQQLGAPAFDPDAPWTPEYDAGWAALKAQYEGAMAGGGGGTLQSQKVGEDGFIYNTFRDGRMVNTGVRADRQMWFRDHPGMEPQLVGKDGSVQTVGMAAPAQGGYGQQAAAPQSGGWTDVGEGVGQVRFNIDGMSQQQQQRVASTVSMMQQAGYPDAEIEQFVYSQMPQSVTNIGQPAAAPRQSLARPSAAQEAAATERARLQAQAEYLPQELAMRGHAAVEQAVGIEQGKARLEQAVAAPGAIATMEQSITAIDELLNSPDLGSIVGLGSINPLNLIPGTAARGLIARAEQISGQAFLAAFNQLKGGGAITEKEGQAATAAMARLDRSQSLADYQAALRDLRAAISPALERQRSALARGQQSGKGQPQQPQQRPVMVNSPAEYNALPAGALYTAPDGSTRRKK